MIIAFLQKGQTVMSEKESVYSNFVELLVFTSDEIPANKVLRVFKDANGFLYLASLVKREGLKTPFSSIEEIELFIGIKLNFLNKITHPSMG